MEGGWSLHKLYSLKNAFEWCDFFRAFKIQIFKNYMLCCN